MKKILHNGNRYMKNCVIYVLCQTNFNKSDKEIATYL